MTNTSGKKSKRSLRSSNQAPRTSKRSLRSLNRAARTSKGSSRTSNRLVRKSKRLSGKHDEVQGDRCLGEIQPVAASSPKNDRILDSDDEHCIKVAKESLEAIKKEVSRQVRLFKFKIGHDSLQLPFTKRLLAKNCHDVYLKGLDKAGDFASKTISGLSTLSFSNVATSSAKNTFQNQEKTVFYDAKNWKQNVSKQILRRNSAKKEVTFNESKTVNVSRTRNLRSMKSAGNDLTMGESSITNSRSNNFKMPLTKKCGIRQVALVTPGPEVNNPLSVLRRPAVGELAVSLFGSPLLVAPDCAPTSMPQINLPTADGKVVSILPREGFVVSDLPTISTPTRSQLRTLNKYLNDMCHHQPK